LLIPFIFFSAFLFSLTGTYATLDVTYNIRKNHLLCFLSIIKKQSNQQQNIIFFFLIYNNIRRMFGFRKLAQHNNNATSISTPPCQDDDEPYLALPVVDNSMTESTSTKVVLFNFEGEDRDTFVLVPGILGFNTIEATLGGKQWIFADYWRDVKDIVEAPFISSPSPLGVSIFKTSGKLTR
jgi:hypothetical protein